MVISKQSDRTLKKKKITLPNQTQTNRHHTPIIITIIIDQRHQLTNKDDHTSDVFRDPCSMLTEHRNSALCYHRLCVCLCVHVFYSLSTDPKAINSSNQPSLKTR